MPKEELPQEQIFWQEFRTTALSRVTEPTFGKRRTLGRLQRELFANRPELIPLGEEGKNLHAISYPATPLSAEEFIKLIIQRDIPSIRELIWRQRQKVFLSRGVVANASLFTNEMRARDPRFIYPSDETDEWTNALFALQITTVPKCQKEFPNAAALKKYAEINGLNIDFEALRDGFVNLVSNKAIQALFKHNLITEQDFDKFNKSCASWITTCALEATFSQNGLKKFMLFPLKIKFMDGFTPDLYPNIYFLPDMVLRYIYFAKQIPNYLPTEKIYPITKIISQTNQAYQFVRDVLVGYAQIQGVDTKDLSFPEIKNNISLGDQFPEFFDKPLTVIARRLMETRSKEVAEDFLSVANLIILTYPHYLKVLDELGKNPGGWNKLKEGQGPKTGIPTYHEWQQEIIEQGGKTNRSEVTRRRAFIKQVKG